MKRPFSPSLIKPAWLCGHTNRPNCSVGQDDVKALINLGHLTAKPGITRLIPCLVQLVIEPHEHKLQVEYTKRRCQLDYSAVIRRLYRPLDSFRRSTNQINGFALQGELKQLCALRAPQARWTWTNPPRSEAEVIPVELPALEEEDLLTNPVEELKRLKELIKNQPDAL